MIRSTRLTPLYRPDNEVSAMDDTFKPELHYGFLSEYLTAIVGGHYNGLHIDEVIDDINPVIPQPWEYELITLFGKYQSYLVDQSGIISNVGTISSFMDIYEETIRELQPTLNDQHNSDLISAYLDWFHTVPTKPVSLFSKI